MNVHGSDDFPYGEGWLCELEVAEPAAVDALLDADGYRRLTET